MAIRKIASFLCLFIGSIHTAYAEWFEHVDTAMGTEVRLELWADDERRAREAIADVMLEMREVDARFSPYIDDSELSLINRQAASRAVPVSREMFELLTAAQRVSEMTAGAFDITYATVGKLYDFRQRQRPSSTARQERLAAIDYRHVRLQADPFSVRFARDGVSIDLGGIAKGHAVDRAIARLAALGIKHAMVSAGGDSRLLGDKRGRPWVTGIKDPRGSEPLLLIPLQATAISTSGDYERFFIDADDDKRYHHILVPNTGEPARSIRSATVIGADATTTDALSTSVFVLGPAKGLHLINSIPGYDAIIIDEHGLLHYSAELQHASSHNGGF